MIWAQGRPKKPLLAKITENWSSLPFLLILGGNSPKRPKKVILAGFYGFRADRTPPGPMNLLSISMVWGASGRPGARRGASFTFYVKCLKFIRNMKFLKFYEVSRSFMKIMNFMKILDFCESGGSKTLIFPRKY